ncbi:MAG: methyltransferase domain-containing protein [Verrucomicrobiota bacterium]
MPQSIAIAGGDTAKPLNLLKRLSILQKHCDGVDAPRFLDGGCGAGDYVKACHSLGWQAKGIEFLPEKVERARAKGLGPETVQQGDLEALPFDDGEFEILLLNEVLEHVPDDRSALVETHRVLAKGGRLFVFSPNRLYPFESHGVFLKSNAPLKPETRKSLPVWTPFVPYLPLPIGERFLDYWARNYWPWQLRKMIREAGFEIVELTYVWQTFEGISGDQSGWLQKLRPTLRKVSQSAESIPGVRCFGVSQFIYARKR